MSWFKDWFNTSYYHLLYKNRDYKEAERFIENLINYFNPSKSSSFLDLACGKGRHSVFLNSLGFNVTGVDLSEESIKKANESSSQTLKFDVHDMREVYDKNQFDFVFNLFTSFGYFDDNNEDIKVLQSVNTMLKTDGVMVLDYLNAEKVVSGLIEQQEIDRGEILFNIKKKIEGQFVVKDIEFEDGGEHYHFQERVKLLTEENFERYFELTGFKVLAKFGDYNLSDFNKESSPRLILIAQKIG